MRTKLILLLISTSMLSGCIAYYPARIPGHHRRGHGELNAQAAVEQNAYTAQYAGALANTQTYPVTDYSNAYVAQNNVAAYPASQYQTQAYYDTGIVLGVREIQASRSSSGAGALIGAVIGGVIGHQFAGVESGGRGPDRGRSYGRSPRVEASRGGKNEWATVGGAVIGGVIGNSIEQSQSGPSQYQLIVQASNGEHRTLMSSRGHYRVGEQVRMQWSQGQWMLQS